MASQGGETKEVSDNLPLRILFYLHQCGDESKYSLSLEGVAQLGLEDDEYGQRVIVEWFIAEYPQPSPSRLANISLEEARAWYSNVYEAPARASASSGISSYSGQELTTLHSLPNYSVVFNSDDKKLYYYDAQTLLWSPVAN